MIHINSPSYQSNIQCPQTLYCRCQPFYELPQHTYDKNFSHLNSRGLMGQEAVRVLFVRIWLRCSLYRDWHHTQKLFALLLLTTARAEIGQRGAFEKDLQMENQGRTKCRLYLERSWEIVTKLKYIQRELPSAIWRYSDELCYALISKIKFHGCQNSAIFE